MEIEYEATFKEVNKDEVRSRLSKAGANLNREEFLQKRIVFNLPPGTAIKGGWLRVRDEGDRITMSLKSVDGSQIHNQKETMLVVDSFEQARDFLLSLGCREKAYQESRRESWSLDGVEITIDEWPFLMPFVEVEGKSEESVREVSEKIGFDYEKAMFCSVDSLYEERYGVSPDQVNNRTPKIVFEMDNPFLT